MLIFNSVSFKVKIIFVVLRYTYSVLTTLVSEEKRYTPSMFSGFSNLHILHWGMGGIPEK